MSARWRARGGNDQTERNEPSGGNERSNKNVEEESSGQPQRGTNSRSNLKTARGRSTSIRDYASCEFDGQLSDE